MMKEGSWVDLHTVYMITLPHSIRSFMILSKFSGNDLLDLLSVQQAEYGEKKDCLYSY